MKLRLACVAILLITLVSCTSRVEKLKEKISNRFEVEKGQFAVAFKNLSSGEELLLNEHEVFHAASTMKTPVMAEVYKQVAGGKLSLSDSIVLKNEFKSIVDGSSYELDVKEDSDTIIYKHIGEKRTVYSLMYDMIIVSSNLATNIMIELVDPKKVTQTLRDMGAKDIQVLRGVEDQKAFEAGMNNQVTAYDLMLLFEKIGKEEMVSKEASQEMIKILLDQTFNTMIPAQLPADVKVAHKTGWIRGVHHDSGIVILPDGKKYVLILLSKKLEDEDAGVKALADVSKMIYDHVTNK